MASFFSLIRYMPNVAAGEAVNVGVLVADRDRIAVRALSDWERIRPFAGSQAKHIRRLVQDMAENPSGFFGVEGVSDIEALRALLGRWAHVLRFSDVKASMETAVDLLATLPRHVLVEESAPIPRRTVVANRLYRAFANAYEERFERSAAVVVQRHVEVQGAKTRHKLDVGVVNGALHAGGFALSFATRQTEKQWKDTDAVAFAAEDLRPAIREREALGVLLDKPKHPSEPYDRAVRLFTDMNVPIIDVETVDGWVRTTMQKVPDPAIAH